MLFLVTFGQQNMTMKRLFILIITAIAFCSAGHAVKALQVPRQYTQPDGSVITLTLCGDEKFAYYRSAEGLVVVNVGNGYYYADGISADNILSSSGVLYHNRIQHGRTPPCPVQALPELSHPEHSLSLQAYRNNRIFL